MVPPVSREAENIHNQLASKHHGVLVNKEWIQRVLSSGLSTVGQVYKTWLTTDITETQSECLPADVSEMTISKIDITGTLTLQLQSVINVGSSFYSQLKKLKGKPIPEQTQSTQYNSEPPPSRMLLLTLTDGTHIVNAMEYRPCSQLSVNMLPGTKMIVSNITARLGVLLLQPGNFRILGGCVERLREVYSQERVLRSALEEEEEGEEEKEEEKEKRDVPTEHTNYNQNSADYRTDTRTVRNMVTKTSQQNTQSNTTANLSRNTENRSDNMGLQRQISSTSAQTPHKTQLANKRQKIEMPIAPETTPQTETNLNLDEFEEFFEPIEENLDLEEIEARFSQETSPTTYQIASLKPNLPFPVRITATISSLASKLLPDPEWTAQGLLMDRSGTADLRLSERLLATMIGYTSTEFKQLKPVSATNASIKSFLRNGLEACQRDLVYKTGMFTVQLNTVNKHLSQFEVTDFQKIDQLQEKELKEYVKSKVS